MPLVSRRCFSPLLALLLLLAVVEVVLVAEALAVLGSWHQ